MLLVELELFYFVLELSYFDFQLVFSGDVSLFGQESTIQMLICAEYVHQFVFLCGHVFAVLGYQTLVSCVGFILNPDDFFVFGFELRFDFFRCPY